MENENLYTFENPEYRKTFWHTSSHVMAQAVKRLWPEVQLVWLKMVQSLLTLVLTEPKRDLLVTSTLKTLKIKLHIFHLFQVALVL